MIIYLLEYLDLLLLYVQEYHYIWDLIIIDVF